MSLQVRGIYYGTRSFRCYGLIAIFTVLRLFILSSADWYSASGTISVILVPTSSTSVGFAAKLRTHQSFDVDHAIIQVLNGSREAECLSKRSNDLSEGEQGERVIVSEKLNQPTVISSPKIFDGDQCTRAELSYTP